MIDFFYISISPVDLGLNRGRKKYIELIAIAIQIHVSENCGYREGKGKIEQYSNCAIFVATSCRAVVAYS